MDQCKLCILVISFFIILFVCQRRGGWWGCRTSWQMLQEESWNTWTLISPPAVSSIFLWYELYVCITVHFSSTAVLCLHALHDWWDSYTAIGIIVVTLRWYEFSLKFFLQIGFLLSVPRLPSMVEKEDFELEGLDFMVCLCSLLFLKNTKLLT